MKTIAVESIDLTIVEAHSSNGANWKKLVAQLTTAQETIASQQAKIDELMLEYCPNEMTPEQLKEYESHQIQTQEGD